MASRTFAFGVQEVMDDFTLSREEVLVACWWAGQWGPRRLRMAFKAWSEKEAGPHLWHGCVNIADPPQHEPTS